MLDLSGDGCVGVACLADFRPRFGVIVVVVVGGGETATGAGGGGACFCPPVVRRLDRATVGETSTGVVVCLRRVFAVGKV